MDAADVSAEREGGEVVRDVAYGKLVLLLAVLGGVLLVDQLTKHAVQGSMHLYQQIDLIGDYVRLTYIHNKGAAFGISLGDYSRQIFMALSVVALFALVAMYWFTPAGDKVRLVAIALICGGAIGNLIDRFRSEDGVVDFMDIGVGSTRWPVFNVADIAVTAGAIVLALSLWKEEQDV
ncbi:MAG TPA: signal peptidase II [Longimicrobiales bacterium]|nr:signal peptidase II [Longimicrobiales bacterium]